MKEASRERGLVKKCYLREAASSCYLLGGAGFKLLYPQMDLLQVRYFLNPKSGLLQVDLLGCCGRVCKGSPIDRFTAGCVGLRGCYAIASLSGLLLHTFW